MNQCNTAVAELKKINKDIIKLRDASEEEVYRRYNNSWSQLNQE